MYIYFVIIHTQPIAPRLTKQLYSKTYLAPRPVQSRNNFLEQFLNYGVRHGSVDILYIMFLFKL